MIIWPRCCQGVSVTSHQLWTPCPRILHQSRSPFPAPVISNQFTIDKQAPSSHSPFTTQNFICFSVCYLPVFTYLQIPDPTLFSSTLGSRTPHEPAQKPNTSIQLRIIELDFLLDSHLPCSKRSPLAPNVNKLACFHLPVVSSLICDRRPDHNIKFGAP